MKEQVLTRYESGKPEIQVSWNTNKDGSVSGESVTFWDGTSRDEKLLVPRRRLSELISRLELVRDVVDPASSPKHKAPYNVTQWKRAIRDQQPTVLIGKDNDEPDILAVVDGGFVYIKDPTFDSDLVFFVKEELENFIDNLIDLGVAEGILEDGVYEDQPDRAAYTHGEANREEWDNWDGPKWVVTDEDDIHARLNRFGNITLFDETNPEDSITIRSDDLIKTAAFLTKMAAHLEINGGSI